ncbi:MAG: hypothetical protein M3416_10785 [Acidobacteriota bacterium]|nr:hypothetical protein [Acidobacteriota bacterium]
MSRKNNVNTDHYKTAGRGRPGEAVAADLHKHTYAQARAGASSRRAPALPGPRARQSTEAQHRRLRRLRRLRMSVKLRGLSARQLMERRMRQRQSATG